MADNGAEFTIEVDRPGMQFLKTRQLSFIPDAQLAPFMKKDLMEILASYISRRRGARSGPGASATTAPG